MNAVRFLLRTALCASLSLIALPGAKAQFTYTFYPNDVAINNAVSTDFAIVGYAGGYFDENDFSHHFTGPSSPTVQVVAGASIVNGMDVFNHSTVNASGGYVTAIVAHDNSTLNISGSNIGFALSVDSAVINMTGGNVSDLNGQGEQINVTGGTIGRLVANTNTDSLGNLLGRCIINVTEGNITGEADAYNDGILNLYGGLLGGDVYARFGGTINIFGSGLVAALINPNYRNTYSFYSLSGTLTNGTVLRNKNLFIENDGVTYGHSSFNLINAVPEPGTVALLFVSSLSGAGVLLRRRRK